MSTPKKAQSKLQTSDILAPTFVTPGAKKSSKRITLSKVPIVVKKCVLSRHFYKNNMKDLKLVDVKKESDVRTWDSKEERLNHYKKIK